MSMRNQIARKRESDQRGFTLLEVMVAIVILALITGALAGAFVTGVGSSVKTDEVLNRSVDAERIGHAWTRDVQNVDPDGVNALGAGCGSRTAPGSQVERLIVSFSWDTASSVGAGVPTKTASWVAVGTGTETSLVRRYCENGSPISEEELARKIGTPGSDVSSLVSGYYGATDATHAWNEFCPIVDPATSNAVSNSCTLNVTGSFQYSVTATRRVPKVAASVVTAAPPGKASNIIANPRNGYISVFWDAAFVAAGSPTVSGYRVYWFADPNGSPIAAPIELSGVSNAATITGLTNGTPYWVRIQAGNSVGWGELSDAAGPATPAPTPPDRPTITGITEGDTALTVSWTPNANDGGSAVTGWRIYAKPLSGPEVGPAIIAGGGAASGTITGLVNGTTYNVTVAGVNALGEGQRSDLSANVVPYGIPGLATITAVDPQGNGSIQVTWTAPSDGGRPILGYRVIVDGGSPAGGPWPSGSTWYPATPPLTANLTGLTLGLNYSFRVLTNNLRGYSTSAASGSTLAAAIPGAPTVSATQSGAGGMTVNWTVPPANGSGLLGYEVTSSPALSGTPLSVGLVTSTSFAGLTAGTTYTFSVRARNAIGWGPTGSGAAVAGGQANWNGAEPSVSRNGSSYPFAVNVSWARPSNPGGACITAYRVEYSTNATVAGIVQTSTNTGTPAAFPGCAGEPTTSLSMTGIVAGVNFRYFRVVAVNSFGPAFESATAGWVSIQLTQLCSVDADADAWGNEDGGGWFSPNRRDTKYGSSGDMQTSKNGSRSFIRFNPKSTGGSNCSEFAGPLPASAVVMSGNVVVHRSDQDKCTFFSATRTIIMSRNNSAWTEAAVTYNLRPSSVNDSDSQDSSGTGAATLTFSVNASDIELQRAEGTRLGWQMRDRGDSNACNIYTQYYTKESGQPATLRITFY